MKDQVDVDLARLELEDGDVLLLCSDGLSGMVPDAMAADAIRANVGDLKLAAQVLVDEANAAGGTDNVTCVLIQARVSA